MTNAIKNETAPPSDPTPSPLASSYRPPADAIRVGALTFVTKALPIAGVNSVNDHIQARRGDNIAGVDIFYLPSLRQFRVERFGPELKGNKAKMIPESRVEFWEIW